MASITNAKILLVEDEVLIADELEYSLGDMGYTVTARANSGEEALAKAKDTLPDVVLMDIVLRGRIDGITTAAQIKNELGIPVIYLTSHSDEETLQRAQVTEPYGYLLKPCNERELKAVIEMTLYKHHIAGVVPSNSTHTPQYTIESTNDSNKACNFLRNVDFFKDVTPSELKLLAETCRFEKVPSQHVLTWEGDAHSAPFIVASGRITMSKMGDNAKELIVEILTPRDPFSLVSALDLPRSALTVKASVASHILWVPQSSFLIMLDKEPHLRNALTHYVVKRLAEAHEFARAMAYDQVEPRVASILYSLSKRHSHNAENTYKAEIEISRMELASLVGISPETASRVAKDMERTGILSLKQKGRIQILDMERLKSAVRNFYQKHA